MWIAGRLWLQPAGFETYVLTVILTNFLCPKIFHCQHLFFHARKSILVTESMVRHFFFVPTATNAEQESTAGHAI
jgi:hypothetical protein